MSPENGLDDMLQIFSGCTSTANFQQRLSIALLEKRREKSVFTDRRNGSLHVSSSIIIIFNIGALPQSNVSPTTQIRLHYTDFGPFSRPQPNSPPFPGFQKSGNPVQSNSESAWRKHTIRQHNEELEQIGQRDNSFDFPIVVNNN